MPNSNPKSFHPAFAQNYQRFYVLRSHLLSKTTEEDKGEDSLGVYLEQPSRDVDLTRVRLSDTLKGEELSTLFSLKVRRLPGGGI